MYKCTDVRIRSHKHPIHFNETISTKRVNRGIVASRIATRLFIRTFIYTFSFQLQTNLHKRSDKKNQFSHVKKCMPIDIHDNGRFSCIFL